VPNFRHAEYMVLPRMAALCEVQWSLAYKKDYENFLKRLPTLVEVYKLYNYNYAKHVVK
jgi:hexosaminidase